MPKNTLVFSLDWFTNLSLERLVYYINPHWDPDSGDNGGGLDVGEAQRWIRGRTGDGEWWVWSG